ncbi:hypothetical protein FHR75_004467 [Kineococcus radiotolerans]|uniref:Uncharacterized protein n=1 Tax=Kineococcus radiotolerans TaxID=131568 RepID=A0A7W4TRA7_KINRA|nr:hypothetical protein [Kineococcus radiotolerans]MBB2903624.1 hypothetical protein [Kineococcus radiotolerans]
MNPSSARPRSAGSSDRCFTLDRVAADRAADGLLILWPDGTVLDNKTAHVRDGVSVTKGSHISGVRVVSTLNNLPGGSDENTKV